MPTLKYRLTKGELIFTATLRKLGRMRTLVAMGLISIAAVLLILVDNKLGVLGWALLAYVILFPVLVALVVLAQLNANPAFTSKTTLTFSDAGVTTVVNGIRSERPWNSFASWSQSEKYLFLNTDKLGTALTIPKCAFTDAQLEMFFDQLSHVNSSLVFPADET